MNTSLSLSLKKKFVVCWKKEYAATVKLNALQKASDLAYRLDKPTARLESQIVAWTNKVNTACDPLIPLIQSGVLGKDATAQCADLLGDIRGYVADCYYAMWLDHKPEKKGA